MDGKYFDKSSAVYQVTQPHVYNNLGMDLHDRDLEDDLRLERDIGDWDVMDDEVRAVQDVCCGEARLNWARFSGALSEEYGEMKHSLSKVDFKKYAKSCCSYAALKERVPILKWITKYSLDDLQGDLIAGTTVGLTCIPQSIAYARIANVNPQHGLYSAFIGSFVYVVFGSARDITLGPSAIMSLMTYSYGLSPVVGDPTYAIALGFFTGIVQLIMYVLGLGFLMEFISFSVLKAFTTAAAITIGMTQVKKWWGLKGVPGDFIPQLIQTVKKIPQTRLYDFLMGIICIFFIVFFKKLKEIKWKTPYNELPVTWKILNKSIWVIGTARNILVLVVASLVAYGFEVEGYNPFSLTGYIPPGIPAFKVPKFSGTLRNATYSQEFTTSDVLGKINYGIIVVPLIGLIEALSIGKVAARKGNYKFDSNQELLSYGIANLLGAFVQGYPVDGTFSRTAVNMASGAKTAAGGIITGGLILLSLAFLTPLFFYIPESALGVVIIMAVLDTMTFHKVWIFWVTRKVDVIPWIVTFVLSFILSVEFGIAIGVLVSLVLLIYPAARPTITVHRVPDEPSLTYVKPSSGLMFPACEYIKEEIFSRAMAEDPKGVIMDFAHIAIIDTSTVQLTRELLEDFHKKGIKVAICNLQKPVSTIFRRAKPKYYNDVATIGDAICLLLDRPKKEICNGGGWPGGKTNYAYTDDYMNSKQNDVGNPSHTINLSIENATEDPKLVKHSSNF